MKIVIVVDGIPVYLEAGKISAYHEYDSGMNCLIVNDLTGEKPRKVGTFRKWDYWHYVEGE